MEKKRWNRIETIIDTALTLNGVERTAYITNACNKDNRFIKEVYSILRSIEEAEKSGFLERAFNDNREFLKELSDRPKKTDDVYQQHIVRRIGPFEITEFVGSGGMGTVFRAVRKDGQFSQEVAVKLLQEDLRQEESIRRFRLEQEILANLNHPNIARLYDGGMTDDGIPYLVMEFIDGVPVSQYCNENWLTLDERLILFNDICAAVQYAHANLVVHRDLKAQNIYVTPEGMVKILDFGIAKLLDSGLTERTLLLTLPGQKFWTPHYAAPEQVTGEPVTTATDIYALGVLLHKLLTDTYPLDLEGKSLSEIEQIIKQIQPSSPSKSFSSQSSEKKSALYRKANASEIIKKLQGDIDAIVLKAIRKEPEYRYASVSQFVEDIERYESGLPLVAQKGTLKYRTAKFLRRHKTGLIATTLLIVILAGFGALYAVQVTEERNRAQLEADKASQVVDFLLSLFEASDPGEADGELITARELLEHGMERIQSLEDQPEVQAQMLDVIGRVYRTLGQYYKAQPLLEQALTKRQQLFGEEHPEVAETMNHLGRVLMSQGDFESAEQLFRNALAIQRIQPDQKQADIAQTLNNLGMVLSDMSDYADAEEIFRESLAIRQSLFGNEHPDVASTMNNLGLLLMEMGDYDQAEAMHRQTLAMRRRLLGNDHLDITYSLNNLALVLHVRDEYEAAEPFYRELLELDRKLLGEEHPEVAMDMNNLAGLLVDMGRFDEGEKLHKQTLAIRQKLLNGNHPHIAQSLNNLASLLVKQNEYAGAKPLYRNALSIRRDVFGDEHPLVANVMSNLGYVLMEQGELDSAEYLQQEALAMRRKLLGNQHADVAASANRLASLLDRKGHHEAAEPLHREAVKISLAVLGESNSMTTRYKTDLGTCLVAQGRYDVETESLLLETDALLENDSTLFARKIFESLITLYEATGRMDEAE